MKKIISIFLFATLLLNMFSLTVFADDSLFSDDFDDSSYKVGETVPYGTGKKWSDFSDRKFNYWTPKIIDDLTTEGTNKVLAVDKSTNYTQKNQHLKSISHGELSGDIYAEFKIYVPSAGTYGEGYNATDYREESIRIGLIDSALATTYLCDVEIRPNHNNKVLVMYDGSIFSNVGYDNWVTIGLAVNTEEGTETVYVNGSKLSSSEITKGKKISEMRIAVNEEMPNKSVIYIDDVSIVKKGDAYKINSLNYSANGAFADTAAAGGKLESVNITKSDSASGNDLIVAVFVNASKQIKAIKFADLQNVTFDSNGNGAVPIGMDLPKSESDISGCKVELLIWENFTNIKPIMSKTTVDVTSSVAPTLYLIGDSTMTYYAENEFPRAGIGQMIGDYFDGVDVVNNGKSGEDTKTYLAGTLWSETVASVNEGDYVYIQLGINDYLHTGVTIDEYKANLKTMVDTLLGKGVNVILATPTVRAIYNGENLNATFDKDGNFVNTTVFTDGDDNYYDAICDVISDYEGVLGFSTVNATAITAELANADKINSKKYYVNDIYANWSTYSSDSRAEASRYNPASELEGKGDAYLANYNALNGDYTHMTIYGAAVVAKEIASKIKDLNNPLSGYVTNLDKEITYPNLGYKY